MLTIWQWGRFAAGATKTYALTTAAGAYTQTGTTATLLVRHVTATPSGGYAVTGTAATLTRPTRRVMVSAGAYSLTGRPAELRAAHQYSLTTLTGSYALTGTAAAGRVGVRRFVALPGTYVALGAPADVARTRVMTLQAGTYAIRGALAGLSNDFAGPLVLAGASANARAMAVNPSLLSVSLRPTTVTARSYLSRK